MNSAELLLHPVRLRIVKTFMGDRALTTAQVAVELEDVPKASLYRHVATLTRAGVLAVVAEKRVRGTIEKTYTLHPAAARIPADEVERMSLQEHAQAFTVYVAGLLADFDRYLANNPTPGQDGAAYSAGAVWLTDAEYADLLRDLEHVFQARLANAPTEGRRRRLTYHVMLPAPESADQPPVAAAPKT